MRSMGSGSFQKCTKVFLEFQKNLFQHFVMLKYIHGKKNIFLRKTLKTLFHVFFKKNLKIGGNECLGSLSSVNSAKYHTLFSQRIPYYVQLYRWIDQCRVSCMDFRYVALLTLNSDFVLGKRLYSKKANPQRR